MAAGEEPPFGTEDFSGPEHYTRAAHYAGRADAAFRDGDKMAAAALAAIGQVHATLAAAAASTLHPDVSEYAAYRTWKDVTGQE